MSGCYKKKSSTAGSNHNDSDSLYSSGTSEEVNSNCQLGNPSIDWGDIEQVKKLLHDEKIDVNDRYSFSGTEGWTALMIACWNGCIELLELLLENSAEVDLQDEKKWSALKRASFKRHNQIVELLLKQGANVNLKDVGGWTALMNASRHGNYELVELLLKKNADPNIRRESGRTALMSAANESGRDEVVKLLLRYGAEISMQEKKGAVDMCDDDGSAETKGHHEAKVKPLILENVQLQ
jgi:ankyrin repeat protein